MIYLDTSAIVKLYIREPETPVLSQWLQNNNQAIPLTRLHDLEFTNALNLKAFRREITTEQIGMVQFLFGTHQAASAFFRPALNWTEVWDRAVELSTTQTAKIGTRSLDILHVASALSIGARRFITFDTNQAKLASAIGLSVISVF